MSKANVQSLCLIASMKSGLITTVQDYPTISTHLYAAIVDIDKMLTKAIKEWDEHPRDNGRALYHLGVWCDTLKDLGLDRENNMTTMVALSQQACADLLAKLKNKKKIAMLEPVRDKLDDIGGYLHDGVSDKTLIPRFELADKILACLYDTVGFDA